MSDQNDHKGSLWADQSGAAAVLFILLAALLLGLVGLSVDVGHISVVRTELQNAADACALAGARRFLPNTVPPLGTTQPPPDPAAAQAAAKAWIIENAADNRVLSSLPDADVQYVIWNYATGTSEAWSWPPALGTFRGPGITVTIKKQGALNEGPIYHALAALFGVTTSDAQATATAALSGVGSTKEGQANFPGEITKSSASQTNEFTLNPNGSQTGAWQTFFDTSTNWKSLTDILTAGTAPATKVGDMINNTNGDLTKTFTADTVGVVDVYNAYVAAGKDWIVVMPIIEDSGNPGGQPQKIIGYASFQITGVLGPPDKTITLKPVTGNLGGGAGGGSTWFGLLSLEPKLVQ
jgi:hypothetical protein